MLKFFICLYNRCALLDNEYSLFDEMLEGNVVSWMALIAGLRKHVALICIWSSLIKWVTWCSHRSTFQRRGNWWCIVYIWHGTILLLGMHTMSSHKSQFVCLFEGMIKENFNLDVVNFLSILSSRRYGGVKFSSVQRFAGLFKTLLNAFIICFGFQFNCENQNQIISMWSKHYKYYVMLFEPS